MAGTLTLEQGVDGTLSQGQEDARNARTSTLRAGSGRPHSARRTSPGLLPGAQLSDLSYGLPRQRNRIAFAADSHENVREGHARAAHPDVARLVSRVDLLSAYTASSCCYVAFMPWCLHTRLTDLNLRCPFCTLGHRDTTKGLSVGVEFRRFYESLTRTQMSSEIARNLAHESKNISL